MPDIATAFGRGRQGGGQALMDLIGFLAEMNLEKERMAEAKRHNEAMETVARDQEARLGEVADWQEEMFRSQESRAQEQSEREMNLEKARIVETKRHHLALETADKSLTALRDVQALLLQRDLGTPQITPKQKARAEGQVKTKESTFYDLWERYSNPSSTALPLTDEEVTLMNQLRTDLRAMNQYDPITGEPFTPTELQGPTIGGGPLMQYVSPSGTVIREEDSQYTDVTELFERIFGGD